MPTSRREFLKHLGIALTSLVSTRCVSPLRHPTGTPTPTCYAPMEPPPTPSPTPSDQLTRQAHILTATAEAGGLLVDATRQAWAAIGRERLRACWFGLDALAQQAADLEKGEWACQSLVAEHRAALDDLMSAGELTERVAGQVQTAFEETAYHVWRNNAPITCYIALPVAYEPRDDLVQRAKVLSGLEGVDQTAVDQAREAMERDIAFFALLKSGQPEAVNLAEQWASGEIEVGEEAIAAAQFLTDLLLGTK